MLDQPKVTTDLTAMAARIEQPNEVGTSQLITLDHSQISKVSGHLGNALDKLNEATALIPQPPYTDAELKELFEKLSNQVLLAQIHYKLHWNLLNAREKYGREMNNDAWFWQYTINAHWLASFGALCRLYDTHDKGLNLRTLMERLQASTNTPWISPVDPVSSRGKRSQADHENDVKLVSRDDPLASKLINQRHKIHAHLDREDILKGGLAFNANILTYDEFKSLFDRAQDLLNVYNDIYRGHTLATNSMVDDDYLHVLDVLKVDLAARDKQCEDEERAMGF